MDMKTLVWAFLADSYPLIEPEVRALLPNFLSS